MLANIVIHTTMTLLLSCKNYICFGTI